MAEEADGGAGGGGSDGGYRLEGADGGSGAQPATRPAFVAGAWALPRAPDQPLGASGASQQQGPGRVALAASAVADEACHLSSRIPSVSDPALVRMSPPLPNPAGRGLTNRLSSATERRCSCRRWPLGQRTTLPSPSRTSGRTAAAAPPAAGRRPQPPQPRSSLEEEELSPQRPPLWLGLSGCGQEMSADGIFWGPFWTRFTDPTHQDPRLWVRAIHHIWRKARTHTLFCGPRDDDVAWRDDPR